MDFRIQNAELKKRGIPVEDGAMATEEQMMGAQPTAAVVVGWAAWVLAGVGGWVDAVGFVTLGHLFTANMSGNSVEFAAYFGLGEMGKMLPCLLAIPVFMAGVFLGTVMLALRLGSGRVPLRGTGEPPKLEPGRASRRGWGLSALQLVYVVEAGLLAALGVMLWLKVGRGEAMDPGHAGAAEVLALLAMGLQNATVRRVGNINLNTTYITNLLQACAQQGARAWLAGRAGEREAAAGSRRESWLAGRLWMTYACGALTGAAGVVLVGPVTLGLPVGGLVWVALGARGRFG